MCLAVGYALAQPVSRRSLTAETWAQSQVSGCGICGERSETERGFTQSTSVFP
jgi:hypothetical protein